MLLICSLRMPSHQLFSHAVSNSKPLKQKKESTFNLWVCMCQRWECVTWRNRWLWSLSGGVKHGLMLVYWSHVVQLISCQSSESCGQTRWAGWHGYQRGYSALPFDWGIICARLCNILLLFNISLWCSCKCLSVPSDDLAPVSFLFSILLGS